MSDESPEILGGTQLPDVAALSPRVSVALGQNPSMFTGPGTNTYLVGTGEKRILLDTGSGHDEYMPFLEEAIHRAGCKGIEGIVLTHAHPDHIGGVNQVREHFGADIPVYKRPWPKESGLAGPGGEVSDTPLDDPDALADGPIEDIDHGAVVETEGARLRALFTPGHAPDHLCYVLEEEGNLFSGDNVLGIGTTVIPSTSGSLADYMDSLELALGEAPPEIYPAHGPKIQNGTAKITEYLEHRRARERQVLEALEAGDRDPMSMVKRIYVGYPESLHAAAAQSVTSHLKKLERDGRVRPLTDDDGKPLWELTR